MTSVSYSDVTIHTFSKSGGFNGFGAHSGTTVQRIKGLKSRTETTMKFKGFLMKAANKKKGEEAHITRIDLDKQWFLNLKKKTYTEHPIKFKKEAFQKENEFYSRHLLPLKIGLNREPS